MTGGFLLRSAWTFSLNWEMCIWNQQHNLNITSSNRLSKILRLIWYTISQSVITTTILQSKYKTREHQRCVNNNNKSNIKQQPDDNPCYFHQSHCNTHYKFTHVRFIMDFRSHIWCTFYCSFCTTILLLCISLLVILLRAFSMYTVSQKNRTLEIFSNISNKAGPISIIFGTENRQ